MIITKETGTIYNELTEDIINFHKDNNLTIAYVERGLNYDSENEFVDDITEEEIQAGKDIIKKYYYIQEADPLFFKYQRGEIDKQVWLDKVNQIKEDWS